MLVVSVWAEGGTEANLDLTVDYPELYCGEDIPFTLNASGGNGTYKYRIYYFRQVSADGTYDVMDPSRFSYQESNVFNLSFYASGTYQLRFTVFGQVNGKYETKNLDVNIEVSDASYPTVEQKADSIVNACLAAGCSTDAEKALWLHDWLINNASYDYSYMYCNAEGVLCRGKGTCESYHRAYSMLLNRCGIQNARSQSSSAQHVWTAVYLGGAWYQIDVTHDDYDYGSSFYRHLYYGLPDSIARMGSLNRSDYTGSYSNEFTYNYFIYTSEIKNWSDPFLSSIQTNLDNHSNSFELSINSSEPDSVRDILYSLVAYDLGTKDYSSGKQGARLAVSYQSSPAKLLCTVTWDEVEENKEEEKDNTQTQSEDNTSTQTEDSKDNTSTTTEDKNNTSTQTGDNSNSSTQIEEKSNTSTQTKDSKDNTSTKTEDSTNSSSSKTGDSNNSSSTKTEDSNSNTSTKTDDSKSNTSTKTGDSNNSSSSKTEDKNNSSGSGSKKSGSTTDKKTNNKETESSSLTEKTDNKSEQEETESKTATEKTDIKSEQKGRNETSTQSEKEETEEADSKTEQKESNFDSNKEDAEDSLNAESSNEDYSENMDSSNKESLSDNESSADTNDNGNNNSRSIVIVTITIAAIALIILAIFIKRHE